MDAPGSVEPRQDQVSGVCLVPAERVEPETRSWDWLSLDSALRPRLLRLGMSRFCLSREESEDIVQTVFINVLTQDVRIRDPLAYIKVSFLNACRNLLVSKGRAGRQDVEDDLPDDAAGAAAGRIEAACAVSGAFRRIEPKCRDLIQGYYLDDQPLAEAAERTGYSKKTVWKRIQKCLEKMRQCLLP